MNDPKARSLAKRFTFFLAAAPFASILTSSSHATNLSLGADYYARGVSITKHEKSLSSEHYYTQRVQPYLTTDLSQDVEATLRVQSISVWGLETSTTPLVTRYPNANGNLWIQNAFVRMPNIWRGRIIATVGRQPIEWGDGHILSDDELGFNAVRLQIQSPFRRLPFELDGFAARTESGIQNTNGIQSNRGDSDLYGAKLGFERNLLRWEVMGLWENNRADQNYTLGSSTTSTFATGVERRIVGVRAQTNVRDAYIKGEYYVQSGNVGGGNGFKLGGEAYSIGMGGKANTTKFGRFGAAAAYSFGSGDKSDTPNEDESFRPTFASRWNGLERKGYGRYFASTFSDVFSSTSPFSPVNSTNTGLPAGASGVETIHFGLESTPWSKWTFTFDFYQYKLNKNILGPRELGSEFDYGFIFRYSGLVVIKGVTTVFTPGDAYPDTSRRKAKFSNLELAIKF